MTVGYVNDGLTTYFLCSPQSQKAEDLARERRTLLTIDHDVSEPMEITAIFDGGPGAAVTDPIERESHGTYF